jgi:hypothetical protein
MSSVKSTPPPTDGPGAMAETKQPTTIRVKHKDMPEIKDAAPGDEVHFSGMGHVHSNRAADKYGDGEAEVDVRNLQHTGPQTQIKGKKNAAKMPMDELKQSIKAASDKEDAE